MVEPREDKDMIVNEISLGIENRMTKNLTEAFHPKVI